MNDLPVAPEALTAGVATAESARSQAPPRLLKALNQWLRRHPRGFLVLAAAAWALLCRALIPASEALVAALPVDRASHLGGSLQFFLYDTPKVLLLLTGIVFVMGMMNSYFTPERTRALLAGRAEGVANVMAAGLVFNAVL